MPVIRAQGRHKPVPRPQQEGFELAIDAHDHNVKQVWVRFGRQDGANHRWDRTIALGDIAVGKGQSRTAISISVDQLPVSPNECFYQFLLEVDGEHDTETLMTVPAKLA